MPPKNRHAHSMVSGCWNNNLLGEYPHALVMETSVSIWMPSMQIRYGYKHICTCIKSASLKGTTMDGYLNPNGKLCMQPAIATGNNLKNRIITESVPLLFF